ncbi:isopentenyl diphosphate isomerase/L-lactate dehydrogenase-like FMN-dependent dehydrogenase [Evansella vedderi]|uniref:L-lactate oxidase n=1 Tax=Evansella vedderi TaxID=38282 RepID=A0ABT9ZW73_9BACI|nr:alpha-hydroxy-acid oxidizing protein [Evansella vedderi]MDQ0255114.1 isopentenyl diphosphate isomerase/L-lactate dehydrogenase-like FMN-dependent dehydrogenase [Evansella vedderi]
MSTALPVNDSKTIIFEKWEETAKNKLGKGAFDYVQSGSGGEETLQKNVQAFKEWDIIPRVLTNVETRDLTTSLFEKKLAVPFFLAPVGFQTVVHPEGELASARAASSLSVPYIASTVSSFSLEEIGEASVGSPRYFQLYWPNDDEVATSFVKRAEAAGYDAIVVTVDTTVLGWRERDLQNQYFPMQTGAGIANFVNDPVFQEKYNRDGLLDTNELINAIRKILLNQSITWEKLGWLKQQTRLPIILKGILHKDDAQLAIEHGIDGIIVSNHGGRQLDGVRSTLAALPSIVEVINGRISVLFDSGVRRGTDIIKALALGADAVLIGRPFVYGLVDGENGVREVLQNLVADLDTSLALTGKTSVKDIDCSIVERVY